MAKEYLKMADVFHNPVTDKDKDDATEMFQRMTSAPFSIEYTAKISEYAAHAINSHDELVAEVERLREFERDAMRYRFLRKCHWNESPLCVVVNPKAMVKLGADCPSKSRLDDAVDELLA